ALALEAHLREKLGVDARSLWTDDGIAMHLPEVEAPPSLEELILDPEEVQALVSAQLPASALFAARFSDNAARSLLLPKRRPGQRTPLWQQRMRSAGLLQVAGQYPDFPILAELLGSEDLRELLDPEAIAAVELELQGLLPERFPRDPDEAHDLLVRLGDLSDDEALARGVGREWLEGLEKERRAVATRIAGQ